MGGGRNGNGRRDLSLLPFGLGRLTYGVCVNVTVAVVPTAPVTPLTGFVLGSPGVPSPSKTYPDRTACTW